MREDQQNLRSYLNEILGQEKIETIRSGGEFATEAAESTAAESRSSMPREVGAMADHAMRKLLAGQQIAPDEQFAIEAIVLPRERPVIDVIKGDYGKLPAPWTHFSKPAIRNLIKPLFRSIGRLELPDHPELPYGGTAFVVGPGLLMTNRHVAELFASGLGREDLAFLPGLKSGIDFLRERDRDERQFFAVVRVVMIHPYWDMALLETTGLEDHPPLTLTTVDPEERAGRDVAVVGYPAFDR
jgi:endonuclease G, mitochondrial